MLNRLLVHDVVKIKYSDEGYLPYYPYHMISDEEMIDAFIFNDSNFFDDFYFCDCEDLQEEHEALKQFIQNACKKYKSGEVNVIPDWIYTYMLGAAVHSHSDQKDVHDLLVLLGMDNLYDEFSDEIYKSIYDVSKASLGAAKTKSTSNPETERPATMFGEPHIIKYLRLEQLDVK